jgi:polar amino acid transport system substrate-binding protein
MNIRKQIRNFLILAAGLAFLGGTALAETKLDQVLKRGTLQVGFDTFVPWAFKDKDGKLAGFEIDVATKLAKDLGVKPEFVPTEWSGIIPALLTDKFDVIIGGLGVTPERALKVNFSNPYEWSGIDVVASKKKLPGLKTLGGLNKKGIVIAVRLGSTTVQTAKKAAPLAEIRQFDTDEALVQEVLNGNAQAAFSSSPTPAFWVADYPDSLYRPLGGALLNNQPSAFAVKKGDFDTLAFFNSWILINQDWLKERADYWYGTRDWKKLLAK